jgi:hypothetical protein
LKDQERLPALAHEYDLKLTWLQAALEERYMGERLLEELDKARKSLTEQRQMHCIVARSRNAAYRILELRHRLPQLLRPLTKQSESVKSALDELLHPIPPDLLDMSYIISIVEEVVRNPTQVRARQFPTPPGATWSDVTIRFLSDHQIYVKVCNKEEPALNYAEAGFEDARTTNPNSAWALLCELAKHGGKLELRGQHKEKVEKAVQALKKQLKALFGITDDPFLSYRSVKCYQTKFTVSFPKADEL